MNQSLKLSSSLKTANMMQLVCIAMLPGALTSIYFFGWGVLINLILCGLFAILSEALVLKLRNKPIISTLKDYSALLTGLLIALAIPPVLPWWMSLIGVSFAIIFAKQLYGGLGFNPFNPAMVGYALLLISFPVEMTAWMPSKEITSIHPSLIESMELIFNAITSNGTSLQDFRTLSDGYTMATPLDHSKTSFSVGLMTSEIMNGITFSENLLGWMWLNISFLIGGIFLLITRVIRWQIPFSMLISVTLTAWIIYMFDDQRYLPAWLHLITGATMLGAFFIATDPVSASTTPKGRIIYGSLIGFIIVIIRTYGGYPDAVAFAVLLMNIAVPTIDHYTKPKVYGHRPERS